MSKVVAAKPVKPPVQEVKADDQDYWTTPVNEYNKVVDAPVTLYEIDPGTGFIDVTADKTLD